MTAGLLDAKPANWAQVEAAGRGDRDAFGMLYQAYRDRIYTFIYYRTRHVQTAEDLTADVFTRAMTRIGTVSWQGVDLGAWLTTIARNLVWDHLKSAAARTTFTVGDFYDPNDFGPDRMLLRDAVHVDKTDGPEMAAVRADLDARVRIALPLLTVEQQRVIGLRFYLGLSVIETAAEMELHEGAVKALTYRAVRTLGRLLKGQDL